MHIHPILAALRRHRIATLLIALEIALACAVLCNACFLIANRLNAMRIVSGVDEPSLAVLSLTGYDPQHANDLNARMVAGLSALPDVKSVGIINGVPFSQLNSMNGITTDPAKQQEIKSLKGKAAIANAKLAYAEFQQMFQGARWEALKAQGANVQRADGFRRAVQTLADRGVLLVLHVPGLQHLRHVFR